MFCSRCEQAPIRERCQNIGVCGRDETTELDLGEIGGIPPLLGIGQLLQDKFNLTAITTAETDLAAMLV